MNFTIESAEEVDSRWIAEIPDLPGVMVYATSMPEARIKAQALALRVIADRIEHGELTADEVNLAFSAA